ncbi:hypothetical protein BKA80DRAFT_279925 [Phyllosticta citrichinensis]
MLLTRHLRQWDIERAVKSARATLTAPMPTSGLPLSVTGQQQHDPALPPPLPVAGQQQHARTLPPLLSVAGQHHHIPALPSPSGAERTIEGPPSKRQKIDRREGESESALPSIVVSPPGEHRAPLLPPLDNPMIPTNQLQQWKLEPDSKENEAPRTSGFSHSTAQQIKIKTEPDTEMTEAQTSSERHYSSGRNYLLDKIGQQTQIKTEPDEEMTEAPTTPIFDDLTAQQTEIKTKPDTEMTEAQTSSGRKDSLYPHQLFESPANSDQD